MRIVDAVAGDLAGYPYLEVVRGELLAERGDVPGARDALARARDQTTNAAERAHLDRRLRELATPSG
jgi:RNA polymerase sigma-70 factor (ECF subfamily)